MTRRLKPFTLLTGRLNKALESYLTDIYPESRQVWFTWKTGSLEPQLADIFDAIEVAHAEWKDKTNPFSSVIVLTNDAIAIKAIEISLYDDSAESVMESSYRLPRSLFAAYFIDDQGEWTSTTL